MDIFYLKKKSLKQKCYRFRKTLQNQKETKNETSISEYNFYGIGCYLLCSK